MAPAPGELAECPQLASRGFYRAVEHPVMGRIRGPVVLITMSDTPFELRHPAPLLGQHNCEVDEGEPGYTGEDLVLLRARRGRRGRRRQGVAG